VDNEDEIELAGNVVVLTRVAGQRDALAVALNGSYRQEAKHSP